jgi:hypothetical protein
MAKIKISQLTAKGANLANTDLLPIAEVSGLAYVTKRVTGAQVVSSAATLTVGTTAIASGTIGRVFFQGTGNVLQQSANLFWDNTNSRLGIGTASPNAPVHVASAVTASAGVGSTVNITNTLTASANNDVLAAVDINPTFSVGAFTGTTQIALRLFGGTTSWFGTQFTNGGIRCNTSLGGGGGISLDSSLPVSNRLNFNSNFTIRSNSGVTTGVDISLFTNSVSNTTGTVSLVGISGSVFSTSGGNNQTNGLLINPTINLNAGNVSTIFRGIHYNPSLSGVTGLTHRAIETTTGNVLFNSTSGNVAIGGTSFGSSSDKVFAQYTGIAPGSSPADAFQMYSADIVGGNAAPHFRTENGNIVKIYQETTGVGSATFVQNAGTRVDEVSTFDGYTIAQVVKALRNLGILA